MADTDASDVSQLVALASAEFGEHWKNDKVNYAWVHANWRQTKDSSRSWSKETRSWREKVKKMCCDTCKYLTALESLSGPESHRSRSPRQDKNARFVPQASRSSLSYGRGGKDWWTQRQAIVDRLVANNDAELPWIEDETLPDPYKPKPHVPMETMDQWVEEFHKSVMASPLCSWKRPMCPRERGIQAIGLRTCHKGYRFKFRFQDHGGAGELFMIDASNKDLNMFVHGTAVSTIGSFGGAYPLCVVRCA